MLISWLWTSNPPPQRIQANNQTKPIGTRAKQTANQAQPHKIEYAKPQKERTASLSPEPIPSSYGFNYGSSHGGSYNICSIDVRLLLTVLTSKLTP
ncbi:MAG: hypothetical protein ABJZ99_00220, partial [Lentilitoribacter sp.]